MDDTRAGRLRDAFLTAGYTVDGVRDLLGPVAHTALARGEHVPALRATTDGSPLATLIRLFLLGVPVAADDVAAATGEVGEPFVERSGGEARALLDVRPYGEGWWVVSDLGEPARAIRPDHVVGVGGASVTLAHATVPVDVGSALDVGTGCGVQALHLSTHSRRVTATDANPRATRLAGFTLALSGVRAELRRGDLLSPVTGETFDLIVANPPFVIGPHRRFGYRDAGMAGDDLGPRLVRDIADHLAEDGWATLLVNWLHRRGEDWRERVAGWFAATECDAWTLQREVQDPAEYVALWLRDAGDDDRARYDEWLDYFDELDADAVGFGIVTMRRGATGDPVVRVEAAPQPVEQPVGPALADWFARQDLLRADDEMLLRRRFRTADDVRLEQQAVRTPDGWAVERQSLRQERGLRWHADVDQLVAALVAGCDGRLPLADLLQLLAVGYAVEPTALATDALPAIRGLIDRGFLTPIGMTG